jgi:hypothetical protein
VLRIERKRGGEAREGIAPPTPSLRRGKLRKGQTSSGSRRTMSVKRKRKERKKRDREDRDFLQKLTKETKVLTGLGFGLAAKGAKRVIGRAPRSALASVQNQSACKKN